MAKKRGSATGKKSNLLGSLVNFVLWIVGILVSLAVGFGMIDGILGVRWIPASVTVIAGWVVVVLTLVSIILAIIDRAQ